MDLKFSNSSATSAPRPLIPRVKASAVAVALLVTVSHLLPGANAQEVRLDSQAFKTNGSGPRQDMPLLLVFVGPPPQGMTPETTLSALRHAATQWSSVACASLALTVLPSVGTLAEVPAGALPVKMATASEMGCIPQTTPPLLAVTPCRFAPEKEGIALNERDYDWTGSSDPDWITLDEATGRPLKISLRATLTHELGHVLGLAHPEEAFGSRLSAMHGAYQLDGSQATLSADDRAGICTLYPVPGGRKSMCDRDATCTQALGDPGAFCKEVEPGFRVCEKEQRGLGDTCFLSQQGCPGLCLISSPMSQVGYCTLACERDDTCAKRREGWGCEAGQCAPRAMEAEELDGCAQAPASHPHPWWGGMGLGGVIFWLRRRSFWRRLASRRSAPHGRPRGKIR